MSECLHKAETHCFCQDGRHMLLDVRQSRLVTITHLERDILAAPEATPLETLRQELRRAHEAEEISRALERLRARGVLLPHPTPPIEADTLTPPSITNLGLNVAQDCNLACSYCCTNSPIISTTSS